MKLIVGLGNPGRKYEGTRHNVGSVVVDILEGEVRNCPPALLRNAKRAGRLEVRAELRGWKLEKRLLAQVSGPYTLYPNPYTLIFAKPTVFMNESGKTVEKILRYYDMKILRNLWIIHDDIDLPLGRIKIQVGGSSAGHKGIESIIDSIGTEGFVRVRLGIGRPEEYQKPKIKNQKEEIITDFVLSKFKPEEKAVVEEMVKRAVDVIKFSLKEGIEKTIARKL